jgi:hypothetical protein
VPKLFSRREDNTQHDPARRKARERMSRLPIGEILDWADQAGSGVAKALNDYRRDGTSESLEDARVGLQTLLGVVEELQSRR